MSTEAKCPFTGGERKHAVANAPRNADWWPDQLNLKILHQQSAAFESDGRRLRLCRSIQDPRPRCGDQRPARADDRFAGLVAGGLRTLWSAVHPHGVAQRRNLPRGRRSRRRRFRCAAIRTAQQLARQRQPRQSAPPVVADQAEIRPQDFVGGSDDPRRQRRARIDGFQNLRLRRRPSGHLGTGRGHLLGTGRKVAGRRALQRRPRSAQPARRRSDGSHLREP